MNLETFLLLLSGKIYIPTLKQLRQGDRQESQVDLENAPLLYIQKVGRRRESNDVFWNVDLRTFSDAQNTVRYFRSDLE